MSSSRRVPILIVDDEATNLQVLAGNLELAGYTPVTATNGKEAIQKLNDEADIKLILLDWMMPEMDGLETLKKIRLSPKYKHIPIIMQTAKDTKADVLAAIQEGADDYLLKPINGDALLEKTRTLIMQGRRR